MGPDVDLIYDAVFAHGRQEALAVGRELERLGYFWYEAPLPPDDVEATSTCAGGWTYRLRSNCSTPRNTENS